MINISVWCCVEFVASLALSLYLWLLCFFDIIPLNNGVVWLSATTDIHVFCFGSAIFFFLLSFVLRCCQCCCCCCWRCVWVFFFCSAVFAFISNNTVYRGYIDVTSRRLCWTKNAKKHSYTNTRRDRDRCDGINNNLRAIEIDSKEGRILTTRSK